VRISRGGWLEAERFCRPSVAGNPMTGETVYMQSETRYAMSGDVSIAYQVIGDGSIDIVFVHGFVSHLEV
jgi:hypothetical protein